MTSFSVSCAFSFFSLIILPGFLHDVLGLLHVVSHLPLLPCPNRAVSSPAESAPSVFEDNWHAFGLPTSLVSWSLGVLVHILHNMQFMQFSLHVMLPLYLLLCRTHFPAPTIPFFVFAVSFAILSCSCIASSFFFVAPSIFSVTSSICFVVALQQEGLLQHLVVFRRLLAQLRQLLFHLTHVGAGVFKSQLAFSDLCVGRHESILLCSRFVICFFPL